MRISFIVIGLTLVSSLALPILPAFADTNIGSIADLSSATPTPIPTATVAPTSTPVAATPTPVPSVVPTAAPVSTDLPKTGSDLSIVLLLASLAMMALAIIQLRRRA
jgi:LPXTG-motif cell wall-anchored protein